MSNLQSLIEVEPAEWTELFLCRVLECAIEQNRFGETFVHKYLADRSYHQAGLHIQKDMGENLIAIGILKNLLTDEAIVSYFRKREDSR